MKDNTKVVLIASIYRIIIIISVLTYANYNGHGYLWLLLLLITSFTVDEDNKKE